MAVAACAAPTGAARAATATPTRRRRSGHVRAYAGNRTCDRFEPRTETRCTNRAPPSIRRFAHTATRFRIRPSRAHRATGRRCCVPATRFDALARPVGIDATSQSIACAAKNRETVHINRARRGVLQTDLVHSSEINFVRREKRQAGARVHAGVGKIPYLQALRGTPPPSPTLNIAYVCALSRIHVDITALMTLACDGPAPLASNVSDLQGVARQGTAASKRNGCDPRAPR